MFVVFVGTGLLAGAWYLARVRPPGADRTSRERAPGYGAVQVSVIVPARDEARTLPRLLTSLRALEPAPYEILVVDDDSTDATATVAAAHGATVIAAGARPPGWAGKPWACRVGAGAAAGTHLLFLDADTWLAPDALARLLDEHAQRGGLVSVQPFHETVRPYEELSAYCNAVAMMGTGAFAPRLPTTARAAFGPCLFTTVADYEASGGHASVRAEVLEDVALAHRYRAAGRPVTCCAGRNVVRFRMYPDGPRRLVQGWSKNIASGAAATGRVAMFAAIVWVAAQVAVALRAATGLGAWALGRAPVPLFALVAYAVVALELHLLLRRIGSFRRLTALAFPVPLVAFLAIFLRSCVLTFVRREVTWRDRTIALGSRPACAPHLMLRVVHLSDPATVLLDIVAWAVVHATTGYVVHHLPPTTPALARDHWWSRPRRFETDRHFYERVLHIKRWKDRVPEAGALFAGGLSKRSLPSRSPAGLTRFAVETRRAELGHWLCAAASPFFVLFNPPWVALVMIGYALAVNLPFIAIQRYNRTRVERVLFRSATARPERSSG